LTQPVLIGGVIVATVPRLLFGKLAGASPDRVLIGS